MRATTAWTDHSTRVRAIAVTTARRASWLAPVAALALLTLTGSAYAASGFGPLSGSGGCLTAPEHSSPSGASGCGSGAGLVSPHAVAVSPDGENVYVASGVSGTDLAASYGSLAVLKRDPSTGAVSELSCWSSDGTDGRDGASGVCATAPGLLGADGVAVSPDGLTVYVTSSFSGAVVAFARDPSTGALKLLGCFQGHPPNGSPCPFANVFFSSGAVIASPDGKALYIAAPTQGSISTLLAGSITPPPSSGGAGTGSSSSGSGSSSGGAGSGGGASGSASSSAEPSVAAIFGIPMAEFFANPCIAVNGLDGACAVGVATQELGALVLSPDGKQIYGAAPGSRAIDVFAPGATGALTETGCLKVEPPPGLCTASRLMRAPTQLAVSPDGLNVYAADSSEGGGQVDVLDRNPSTGALSTSGCVDFLPAPSKEENEEEGGGEKESSSEPTPKDPCTSVPGLGNVSVVAVSGDGSAVYAIGDGSAAVFARDPSTGKLTETACAANEDSRCTTIPDLEGVEGAAVSPDGRNVYVAAARSNTVMAFGIGAAVVTAQSAATRAGTARVLVACPRGLRRPCAGHLEFTRVTAVAARRGHRLHVTRAVAGASRRFSIRPGARARVAVRLGPATWRLLLSHGRLA